MKKKNLLFYICNYIFSFIFSCVLILMKNISFKENEIPINFIKKFNFNLKFFITAIIISILIFLITYFIVFILSKIHIKEEENTKVKKICIITFLGIFITGILFLITYYPGNSMIDTFFILNSPIYISNQHPILYNLLIYVPFVLFNKITNNINLSYFLLSIVQLITIDVIITFIIGWFYKTFKNKKLTILLMLYFILVPIITNYNTTIVKDSVFAVILMLYIPIIYSLISSKGKWIENKLNTSLFALLLILTSLIRNNGIFIVVALFITLILVYKTNWKKWILLLLITILISSSTKLIPVGGSNLFQEKVGIPLQQLGYILYTDKDLNKETKNYLNNLMPLAEYKSKYNPYFVDNIKWNNNFNRIYLDKNSSKFIKIWFKELPNNFEDYVKSYILITYGTWAPDKMINSQSRFLGLGEIPEATKNTFIGLENKKLLPNKIQSSLESFYEKTTTFFNSGSCIWMLILFSLLIVYTKKYILLILTIPLYTIWITLMIASPLSTAFRYMVPFAYSLPIILGIIFTYNKKTSQK